MKEMLYMKCGFLKSNEDMILALAGQFKHLSYEPEPASQRSWVRIPLSHLSSLRFTV